jgi:hypothetical protein
MSSVSECNNIFYSSLPFVYWLHLQSLLILLAYAYLGKNVAESISEVRAYKAYYGLQTTAVRLFTFSEVLVSICKGGRGKEKRRRRRNRGLTCK